MLKPYLLSVFTVAALSFNALAAAGEQRRTLAVENMLCPACSYMLEVTLSELPGVKNVEMSHQDQTAVVVYDDAQTGVAAFIEAATELGYPAREVK